MSSGKWQPFCLGFDVLINIAVVLDWENHFVFGISMEGHLFQLEYWIRNHIYF